MLNNKEGQAVPSVTFRTRQGDQWVDAHAPLHIYHAITN